MPASRPRGTAREVIVDEALDAPPLTATVARAFMAAPAALPPVTGSTAQRR